MKLDTSTTAMKSPRPTTLTARSRVILLGTAAVILAVGLAVIAAELQPQIVLKSETFNRVPGWDGHNNRVKVEKPNPVVQDFGYSQTNRTFRFDNALARRSAG